MFKFAMHRENQPSWTSNHQVLYFWFMQYHTPSALSLVHAVSHSKCIISGSCSITLQVHYFWFMQYHTPSALSLVHAVSHSKCIISGSCSITLQVHYVWFMQYHTPSALFLVHAVSHSQVLDFSPIPSINIMPKLCCVARNKSQQAQEIERTQWLPMTLTHSSVCIQCMYSGNHYCQHISYDPWVP